VRDDYFAISKQYDEIKDLEEQEAFLEGRGKALREMARVCVPSWSKTISRSLSSMLHVVRNGIRRQHRADLKNFRT
jgi:hypothetical protein